MNRRATPLLSTLLAALLGLVAALTLVSGGSAQAAPAQRSGVEVSLHPAGPFASQLPHRLFQGTGRMVPGDRVTRTFYLRNNTTVEAHASMQVAAQGDEGLARALRVRVAVGDQPQVDGPVVSARQRLLAPASLAPGEVQAVTVSLRFRDAPGQLDMSQRVSLGLVATLTEAPRRPGDGGDTDTDGNGDVDGTGAVVVDGPTNASGAGCQAQTSVALNGEDVDVPAPAEDRPVCVPSAVDSGTSGPSLPVGEPTVASTAVVGLLAGALLFLLAGRRRRGRGLSQA